MSCPLFTGTALACNKWIVSQTWAEISISNIS